MSKTAQRKREYFNQGKKDFEQFGSMFIPVYRENHPFNIAYKAGFHEVMRKRQPTITKTLLQWFRDKFLMDYEHK